MRGYFAIQLGTSPEKRDRALEGIREQLARMREEPVPAQELEGAKAHLIGIHAIRLQRRGSLAATFALDHVYGLPADGLHAVCGADLRRQGEAHLGRRHRPSSTRAARWWRWSGRDRVGRIGDASRDLSDAAAALLHWSGALGVELEDEEQLAPTGGPAVARDGHVFGVTSRSWGRRSKR